MNILVTGANGQLGTHLRILAAHATTNRWLFSDIDTLDITDADAVARFIDTNDIECIVNCAAYTNVDAAEDAEADADRVNHLAVAVLANAMAARDGLLVHISTDYVFGGNELNSPCNESTPVNPLGAYGRTKLAGEQALLASSCQHILIRTSWLYSEYGRNFVKTMLNLFATRPTVNVVCDQIGTPTYAGDLASAIFTILESELYRGNEGLYHYSNEGSCSWYDFAKAIARLTESTCDVRSCLSSEYPSKVHRPSYSVLDKSKFKASFHIDIPDWEISLRKCLENLSH
ncbi:MAG: dTDP-4-dehydrorhamnose reductase [Bacteroidales bacterium]|nr:dTDP-4-dehydrorhamnose reductase [Bacteroidales bacterium]